MSDNLNELKISLESTFLKKEPSGTSTHGCQSTRDLLSDWLLGLAGH